MVWGWLNAKGKRGRHSAGSKFKLGRASIRLSDFPGRTTFEMWMGPSARVVKTTTTVEADTEAQRKQDEHMMELLSSSPPNAIIKQTEVLVETQSLRGM